MRIRYDFSSKKAGKFRKSPTSNAHRVAFPKLVRTVIDTSDLVLEVLDARFIDKTRNIEMENYVKSLGKRLLYIINKVDLVKIDELKANYDLSQLKPYVFFSGRSKVGRSKLRLMIKIEMKKMKITHAKGRVGIIGYPNTGKSTIINILSGKKGTATSSEAGFTKAQQKIRFNKDIIIIDTPGVFQEKENPEIDIKALSKHAIIGIKGYEKIKDPDIVVSNLMIANPGLFESFYKIEANGDAEVLIEQFGRRRNLLKKGGEVDIMRAAKEILKDWQKGKIKRN